MTNYPIVLASFALLVLASGCNNDDDNPPGAGPEAHTCFISKEIENSFVTESIYDSQNRLIRIDGYQPSGALSDFAIYTYSPNGKLDRVEEFNGVGDLLQYSTYEYDGQLRLGKTSSFFQDTPGGPFLLSFSSVFEYNAANQIFKISYFENGAVSPEFYELLDYSGNNVTQVSGFAPGATNPDYTYTYTYDNKRSPLRGLLHSDVPMAQTVSVNNRLTQTLKDETGTVVPEESFTYSYAYNAQGYPVEWLSNRLDGITGALVLEYNCP